MTRAESSFQTVHPGEVLKGELEKRGIKHKDFAATVGMPASMLSDIIKGKRNITPDISILLEAALGIQASSWLRLQAERDLEVARAKEALLRKQQDIKTWQCVQDYCDVKYLEKALPAGLGKSIREKIDSVFAFFNVKSEEELKDAFIRDLDPAFFRKSSKLSYDPVSLFTWKQIAYNSCAQQEELKKFNPSALPQIIEELKSVISEDNETIERVTAIMRKHGIRFIILDNEKGIHVDGFSFWRGANPSIVLTLRHKKIDVFAFTLMHEVCHVFCHLNSKEKSRSFISLSDLKDSIEEKEADVFANNVLLPAKEWQLFKEENARTNPYKMGSRIRAFANEHKIHPAIVLGRYQHDFNVYDNGRGFDRAIR